MPAKSKAQPPHFDKLSAGQPSTQFYRAASSCIRSSPSFGGVKFGITAILGHLPRPHLTLPEDAAAASTAPSLRGAGVRRIPESGAFIRAGFQNVSLPYYDTI